MTGDQNNFNEYIFSFAWEKVVKGFWTKYPNKSFSNVIFNKVIDMKIIDDHTLFIQRMMFSEYFWFWGYSIENITLDLQKKKLEMNTVITKRSRLSPSGKEICIYEADKENDKNTIYRKALFSNQKIVQILGSLNLSFKKGCHLIEDYCKKLD